MRKYLIITVLLMTTLSSIAQTAYAASSSSNPCEGDNLSKSTVERCAARKRVQEVRAANLARQSENRKLRESNKTTIQNIVSTQSGTTTRQAIKSLTGSTLASYTGAITTIVSNQQKSLIERSEARLNQLRIVVPQILQRLPRTTVQQRVTINASINKQIDAITKSKLYTTESKAEMLQLLQSIIDYKVSTLELKQSPTAAPVGSTITANSTQEIGRFAFTTGHASLSISSLRIANKGTASLKAIAKDVYIVDVSTGNKVGSSGIYMSGVLVFSDLNQGFDTYSTRNYKVMADIGDVSNQAGKTIELFINPKSIVVSAGTNETTVNILGNASFRVYTISATAQPSMGIVKVADNVFKITISNQNTDAVLNLEGITLQVRPIASDSNYTATACLRDEGSTLKCSDPLITSGTGAVPGLATKYTLIETISASSSITKELYVDSNFVNPATLQVELSKIYYNGTSESYNITAQ